MFKNKFLGSLKIKIYGFNPSESTTTDGLTITPLSYHVKYVDNNQAEVIVFTTKNSHLVATRKFHEYLNINTKKNN